MPKKVVDCDAWRFCKVHTEDEKVALAATAMVFVNCNASLASQILSPTLGHGPVWC